MCSQHKLWQISTKKSVHFFHKAFKGGFIREDFTEKISSI